MNKWIETKTGKLVEVHAETESFFAGREILLTKPKLVYGDDVVIPRYEAEDDGTEDDLATIFKNTDELVEDFFEKAEEFINAEKKKISMS